MSVDRREFLGALAVPFLVPGSQTAPLYDLVVKGGHVIDPDQGLSAVRDVAVSGTRIARVAPDIPAPTARRTIGATGLIVTPGLIDVHVHVYDGVASVAAVADDTSLARGVTTVVDAGSAGATTFQGFRKYIIAPSRTRIYAALNISTVGLTMLNELEDLSLVDPKAAVAVVTAHRDSIVAIKVRLGSGLPHGQDLEVLRRARLASDESGVPLMLHIGGSSSPLDEILRVLRRGDMVTHTLREQPNGVIDAEGRVRDAFVAARERGVWMDVAHGSGNFSWATAERAAAQGWWPDTISSDLHARNTAGPVHDLATTLSKFLLLGLSLEEVVARASSGPAKVYRFPTGCGTLREGAEADVAAFRLSSEPFVFADSRKETRTGARGLVPEVTLRAGEPVGHL
ncbi:MAG: amidohydrolase/deacetylase family metallohydrolase [Acidobacteria bacterium]|nr:amidohydrolase/deacetylase family metallohydrolase [Acidobacteriota bacterium]